MLISESDFKETREKLFQDIFEIRAKIQEIEDSESNPLEPVQTVLARLNEAVALENSTDEFEKFEFLKNVGSNHEIANQGLEVTWEKPFAVAAKWKSRFLADAKNASERIPTGFW